MTTRTPIRDEAIMTLRQAGWTLAKIGDAFSLTPARIYEILNPEKVQERLAARKWREHEGVYDHWHEGRNEPPGY